MQPLQGPARVGVIQMALDLLLARQWLPSSVGTHSASDSLFSAAVFFGQLFAMSVTMHPANTVIAGLPNTPCSQPCMVPTRVFICTRLSIRWNARSGSIIITPTFAGNVDIGNLAPTARLNVTANAAVSGNVDIGTTAPASKLDVRGDIRLGSSAQFFAPGAGENLRIVRGNVTITGASSGIGFTSSKLANSGRYQLTFPPGTFTDVPAVTITARTDGTDQDNICNLRDLTATGVTVIIVDENGTGNLLYENSAFSFIAIGAR